MRRSDLVLAFLISPLVTPLTLLAALTLAGRVSAGEALEALIVFRMFVIPAYLAVLLFGVPAFLLYRFAGWRGVGTFALGGMVIGALVGHLVTVGLCQHSNPYVFRVCVLAGGLSALTFRLLLSDYYARAKFE